MGTVAIPMAHGRSTIGVPLASGFHQGFLIQGLRRITDAPMWWVRGCYVWAGTTEHQARPPPPPPFLPSSLPLPLPVGGKRSSANTAREATSSEGVHDASSSRG